MTRDWPARALALIALAASFGLGSAYANSITEPDAYAVGVRVTELEGQIGGLEDQIAALEESANDQAEAIDTLAERTGPGTASDCLATSDRHFVRETVNGGKRRWKLPIVVWNRSRKACR